VDGSRNSIGRCRIFAPLLAVLPILLCSFVVDLEIPSEVSYGKDWKGKGTGTGGKSGVLANSAVFDVPSNVFVCR